MTRARRGIQGRDPARLPADRHLDGSESDLRGGRKREQPVVRRGRRRTLAL